MSVGFEHLLGLHYRGSSLGPGEALNDRALVTEIINLKMLFAPNAPQELFTSRASWWLIVGEVVQQMNEMQCSQISSFLGVKDYAPRPQAAGWCYTISTCCA